MADPLPAPKRIFDLEGDAQVNADGRGRQERATSLRGGDRDATLLALLCASVALGALAIYKLANVIASVCWACG